MISGEHKMEESERRDKSCSCTSSLEGAAAGLVKFLVLLAKEHEAIAWSFATSTLSSRAIGLSIDFGYSIKDKSHVLQVSPSKKFKVIYFWPRLFRLEAAALINLAHQPHRDSITS